MVFGNDPDIPIILFITEKKRENKDRFYATLFSLILIPTSYIHFSFAPIFLTNPGEVDDSVLFHPIIILILVSALVFDVLQEKELNKNLEDIFSKVITGFLKGYFGKIFMNTLLNQAFQITKQKH